MEKPNSNFPFGFKLEGVKNFGLTVDQIDKLRDNNWPKEAYEKDPSPHLKEGINISYVLERLHNVIGTGNFETYYEGSEVVASGKMVKTNVYLFVNGHFVAKQPGGGNIVGVKVAHADKTAFADGLKRCCYVGLGMMQPTYRGEGIPSDAEAEASHRQPQQPPAQNKPTDPAVIRAKAVAQIKQFAEDGGWTPEMLTLHLFNNYKLNNINDITSEIAFEVGQVFHREGELMWLKTSQ